MRNVAPSSVFSRCTILKLLYNSQITVFYYIIYQFRFCLSTLWNTIPDSATVPPIILSENQTIQNRIPDSGFH